MRALTPGELALLLLLSLVNYLLRALRWHIFATRLGLALNLVANVRHFLGGFAMSVTPGRVGELVRMRWIRRETGWSFERTAPLVLIDRAMQFRAVGAVGEGGVLVGRVVSAWGRAAVVAAFMSLSADDAGEGTS